MNRKIKSKVIVAIEQLPLMDCGEFLVANGSKVCPICKESFLYSRGTKQTCGKYRCVRLNRMLNKGSIIKKENNELWVQETLI